ncbi:MAG: cation:proton antiporter [Opitutaceae bacterium]
MEIPIHNDVLLTLCLALSAGMGLILVSRRLGLPTIVLLLFGGVILGPEGLGVVQPDSLGPFLPVVVSLSVALILFEGGLTLDLHGYFQGSIVIRRLLTVGVVITWLGGALAVWAIFGTPPSFSLLVASLIVVTGPTVIVPILKRIKVEARLHSILHWEGVLIDAIGVFLAILCFEWVVAGEEAMAIRNFAIRIVSGLTLGLLGGYFIYILIRRRVVPEGLINGFALASAVLLFGLTEAIMSEAGLLSVTVAGLVIGWKHPVELREIRQFKGEVTELLIGLLFILLSARLELNQFIDFGLPGLLLVLIVIFVIRPLNVLASTWRSGLRWQEKAFLSWVAPRGIVAASMASLFSIALASGGREGSAAMLETVTYSVIVATVVVQGFTAGWVARLLRVTRPPAADWLICGAHELGRAFARFIHKEAGLSAWLIDNNPRTAAAARRENLEVIREDALASDIVDELDELQSVGYILALTDNIELNELICQRWSHVVPRDHLFRWAQTVPTDARKVTRHGRVILSGIPHPSLVSAELSRGDAILSSLDADKTRADPPGTNLAVVRGGKILPEFWMVDDYALKPDDRCLHLVRTSGFLDRSLEAGDIVDLEPDSMEDLYDQLVAHVVALNSAIDAGILHDSLEERERLFPTTIGHGVSVPHAYVEELNDRLCVVARIRGGMSRPGTDERIHLVFLILSPHGDSEGHLGTMAEVARFSHLESNRRAVLDANTPEEALRFIRNTLRH